LPVNELHFCIHMYSSLEKKGCYLVPRVSRDGRFGRS
jgi:hypothetical protein